MEEQVLQGDVLVFWPCNGPFHLQPFWKRPPLNLSLVFTLELVPLLGWLYRGVQCKNNSYPAICQKTSLYSSHQPTRHPKKREERLLWDGSLSFWYWDGCIYIHGQVTTRQAGKSHQKDGGGLEQQLKLNILSWHPVTGRFSIILLFGSTYGKSFDEAFLGLYQSFPMQHLGNNKKGDAKLG